MKPYIQTLKYPHLDIAMIVEITSRSFDLNTVQVKVLDFFGDENMLIEAESIVEDDGIYGWVNTFGQGGYDGKYTVHEKVISANALRGRYVNYRSVDPLHIDKLMGLGVTTMTHSVEKFDGQNHCDFIDGILALPGNFIVARAHNKVVDRAGFNKEMGMSMVTSQLGNKARDTLFELEGYRLFRNLNTLDDILSPERNGLDLSNVPACIANGADYINVPKGTIYIVVPLSFTCMAQGVNSASQFIPVGAHYIPAEAHFAAKAIINSYIEKR